MSTRNRIPTAIEPLLRLPPEASLTILTGTLGCSPAWLTSRLIGSALGHDSTSAAGDISDGNCSVVLVSWMRDLTFWKSEVRRAMGVDFSKAFENKRFAFIDCLSEHTAFHRDFSLFALEKIITEAIGRLAISADSSAVTLVLDGPDALLAAGSATAHRLNGFTLKLRSLVHSTVLVCSADQPLMAAASQGSEMRALPLETESARFLAQQAHNARILISVRELATGAARDVSGVLRVTRSDYAYGGGSEDPKATEMEALYLVQRDGGIKVFQRGTDAG